MNNIQNLLDWMAGDWGNDLSNKQEFDRKKIEEEREREFKLIDLENGNN